MNIANQKGVWLISRAQFRFVDGENGTVFEPHVPTKALRTQWVKDQSVIVRCIDPTMENAEDAQAELDALNAADAAERDGRQAKAEKIMAADNEKLNSINSVELDAIKEKTAEEVNAEAEQAAADAEAKRVADEVAATTPPAPETPAKKK